MFLLLPQITLCHRLFCLQAQTTHVSLPQLWLLLISCWNDPAAAIWPLQSHSVLCLCRDKTQQFNGRMMLSKDFWELNRGRCVIRIFTELIGVSSRRCWGLLQWTHNNSSSLEEISDWRCNLWPEGCLKCKNWWQHFDFSLCLDLWPIQESPCPTNHAEGPRVPGCRGPGVTV